MDGATGDTETTITRIDEEDQRVAVIRAEAKPCPYLPGVPEPANANRIADAVAAQMRKR